LPEADRIRYFDPIALTDASGGPVDWLKPYVPSATKLDVRPIVLST
jgi:hypothetical protein